jgi:hypothetical protein
MTLDDSEAWSGLLQSANTLDRVNEETRWWCALLAFDPGDAIPDPEADMGYAVNLVLVRRSTGARPERQPSD